MKFIKNYWFPLLIGMIVLTIIGLFGDFSFLTKINGNRNKNIYKIYQLYDRNSDPISYEYKILELSNKMKFDDVIDVLINKIKGNLPKNTKIKNYELDNGILILNLSKDFIDNYPMDEELFVLNLYSVVNTFTYLKDINGVHFMVEDQEIQLKNILVDYSESFINNVSNFIIYSPLNDKIGTYLYRDTNYALHYKDAYNVEYKKIKLMDLKNSNTILQVSTKDNDENYKNQKETWDVDNDGLYINQVLILPTNYKVNDEYKIDNFKAFVDSKKYKADALVEKVYRDDDNSIVVVLNITIDKLSIDDKKYSEIIFLKQGYGLIQHQIIDQKNNYSYDYQISGRSFVGSK